MKFSFVIPTYNKREVLRRTLDALNRQEGYTREDYEVIVVDDGSQRAVYEAIRGVNRNYYLNYLYLQRFADSCRARSRNYGIKLARGKYIAFIDDDIIVTPRHLRELERYYNQSENMVIIGTRIDCPYELLEEKGEARIRNNGWRQMEEVTLEARHVALNNLSFNAAAHKFPWAMAYTCNLSAPRKMLLKSGGFDENFKKWGYEDTELTYRLSRNGARFMVNPRLEAIHQSHPRGPEGENNHNYFVEKCGDVFEGVPLAVIFSMFSPDSKAKLLWKYRGTITSKKILNFKSEAALERVKEKILEYAKIKDCKVTVIDYVNTTDLDLWIQMREFEDALVTYYPAIYRLTRDELITSHIEIARTNAPGKLLANVLKESGKVGRPTGEAQQ